MLNRVAFSGRLYAGKDYVADRCGYKKLGFADPIYELVETLCGTQDKAKPGIRKMMQYVGQIGWGCLNETYPWTPERALLVKHIQREGGIMTQNFAWVNWMRFGLVQTFWVDILLDRLDRGEPGGPCAVTNVRFRHELDRLTQHGFYQFHVACSPGTQRARAQAKGAILTDEIRNDTSENLAAEFDETLPHDRVIWNDPGAPQPVSVTDPYLTVDEFVTIATK